MRATCSATAATRAWSGSPCASCLRGETGGGRKMDACQGTYYQVLAGAAALCCTNKQRPSLFLKKNPASCL